MVDPTHYYTHCIDGNTNKVDLYEDEDEQPGSTKEGDYEMHDLCNPNQHEGKNYTIPKSNGSTKNDRHHNKVNH